MVKKEVAVDTSIINSDDPNGRIAEAMQAVNTLISMDRQVTDNALAIARQVGYDGTLTIGALEDGIRFYQHRTVEACLELGKRLLILKELTPHGDFVSRVELLGISKRMAQKFMSATLKLSKANSSSLLKSAGTQTKLLELLVLDDGEIQALESGETVRGVTLDKIETMSVSELKKALRDANDRIDAKDQVIKDKSAKIDEQAEKLAGLENKRRNPVSAEQRLLGLRGDLQATAANIKTHVMTELRKNIKALYEDEIGGTDEAMFMGGCLIEIGRELEILRCEYNLPRRPSTDLTPEWMLDVHLAETGFVRHD